MKIGIYGGSFDPVHIGHVRLARFMLDTLGLDRLLIVPAYVSPFKRETNVTPEDRLAMCRLAFPDERFEVVSDEIDRGGKSYTVDTVKGIRERYGENDYYLIIGSDQLLLFDKWYRFEDILADVTLCAVSRCASDDRAELESFADEKLRAYGPCIICDFEPVEISSTAIREGLRRGDDMSRWLPAAEASYITDRGLYT